MSDFTLTEAVRSAIIKELSSIHTCLPGRIEKYDNTKQLASVTPLIKKKFADGTLLPMPIIENVPVVWPRGGGASLTFPLEQGDGVLLVFSERSMDTWLSVGGEAEPGSPTMFDLSDAIAVPGLNSFNVASHSPNNDDVQLTKGTTRITIKKNGNVEIDGDNIELGTIIKALVNDTFLTIYDAHTHVAPSGGGTTAPPLPISIPANLTTKTKAE